MRRLFGVFHYRLGIKLLAFANILVMLVCELLGNNVKTFLPNMIVALSGGIAMFFMIPQLDEYAKESFIRALLLFLLIGACYFLDNNYSLTLFFILCFLLSYFVRSFSFVRSRIRIVLRRQLAWYAMVNQMRLVMLISFNVLVIACILSKENYWLMRICAGILLIFFIFLVYSVQKERLILLSKDQEHSLRRIITCDMNDISISEGRESPAMNELYGRIIKLMESSKPYLREDYSLQDLAGSVYSNKTYLSKTINLMSGKNFRQFINSYRVLHSVELIKRNPKMRVEELAVMSGFHSSVTYNMAFKANMQETPGEYAQKLRSNLSGLRAKRQEME